MVVFVIVIVHNYRCTLLSSDYAIEMAEMDPFFYLLKQNHSPWTLDAQFEDPVTVIEWLFNDSKILQRPFQFIEQRKLRCVKPECGFEETINENCFWYEVNLAKLIDGQREQDSLDGREMFDTKFVEREWPTGHQCEKCMAHGKQKEDVTSANAVRVVKQLRLRYGEAPDYLIVKVNFCCDPTHSSI